MIIDAVKQFFKENYKPVSNINLNVNYFGEKSHSGTIEVLQKEVIVKKYPDGSSLRNFDFAFATMEFFDSCTQDNLEVMLFYENFASWIEEQNEKGNLPKLGSGLTPICFEVLSPGYLHKIKGPQARYQINLRLIYEKD